MNPPMTLISQADLSFRTLPDDIDLTKKQMMFVFGTIQAHIVAMRIVQFCQSVGQWSRFTEINLLELGGDESTAPTIIREGLRYLANDDFLQRVEGYYEMTIEFVNVMKKHF